MSLLPGSQATQNLDRTYQVLLPMILHDMLEQMDLAAEVMQGMDADESGYGFGYVDDGSGGLIETDYWKAGMIPGAAPIANPSGI